MREAPFVERVDCSLQLLARAIGSSKVGKRKGYRDRERVEANCGCECSIAMHLDELSTMVDRRQQKE